MAAPASIPQRVGRDGKHCSCGVAARRSARRPASAPVRPRRIIHGPPSAEVVIRSPPPPPLFVPAFSLAHYTTPAPSRVPTTRRRTRAASRCVGDVMGGGASGGGPRTDDGVTTTAVPIGPKGDASVRDDRKRWHEREARRTVEPTTLALTPASAMARQSPSRSTIAGGTVPATGGRAMLSMARGTNRTHTQRRPQA